MWAPPRPDQFCLVVTRLLLYNPLPCGEAPGTGTRRVNSRTLYRKGLVIGENLSCSTKRIHPCRSQSQQLAKEAPLWHPQEVVFGVLWHLFSPLKGDKMVSLDMLFFRTSRWSIRESRKASMKSSLGIYRDGDVQERLFSRLLENF